MKYRSRSSLSPPKNISRALLHNKQCHSLAYTHVCVLPYIRRRRRNNKKPSQPRRKRQTVNERNGRLLLCICPTFTISPVVVVVDAAILPIFFAPSKARGIYWGYRARERGIFRLLSSRPRARCTRHPRFYEKVIAR